jgi:quinol monooxygenase YgiN
MGRFAQHTRLVAAHGNTDRLASKFLESVELQQENPACEFMIVCKSPMDAHVVYVAEVWSSEAEWEEARSSPVIAEWAKDIPTLVAEAPQSVRLDPVGRKGFLVAQACCPLLPQLVRPRCGELGYSATDEPIGRKNSS